MGHGHNGQPLSKFAERLIRTKNTFALSPSLDWPTGQVYWASASAFEYLQLTRPLNTSAIRLQNTQHVRWV